MMNPAEGAQGVMAMAPEKGEAPGAAGWGIPFPGPLCPPPCPVTP